VLFRSPERALRAVARVTAHGRALRRWILPRRATDVAPAPPPARGVLPEHLAKPWLAAIGLPVPDGALARSRAEAEAIAARIGYPVVIKAQAKDLPHKSDAGGVMLDIADAAALGRAWDRLHASLAKARPELSPEGVLVERMSPPGIETVVGARRDPDWGAVVMVGLGGIFVEALDDVRLVAPDATMEEIVGEIGKLRGSKLLAGMRGAPPADTEALADIISKIAALMRARPEIAEIDLNPVMVYAKGKGACALDALVVVDDEGRGEGA
jgi:acyl-CoA synthetase (NDP forming)